MKELIFILILFGLTLNTGFSRAGGKSDYNSACKDQKQDYDDVKTACAEAKNAKNNVALESTKLAVYTAATVYTSTLAAIEDIDWTQAARTSCIALGIAVPATTLAADLIVGGVNGKIAEKAMSSMTSITTIATNAANFKDAISAGVSTGTRSVTASASGGGGTAATAGRTAATASRGPAHSVATTSAQQAVHKAACKGAAIGFGASTGMSALGLAMAKMTFDKASKLAVALHDNPANQADLEGNYAFLTAKPDNVGGGGDSNSNGNTSQTDAMTAEDCTGKSGNDYLKCLGKLDTDIAKISNNKDFMDQMSKFLGGQSLGDFAKNAPADKDAMPAYVAGAMGLGAGGADAIKKAMAGMEKLAQDSGAMKYNPSSATASRQSLGFDSTPDFNRLMADMMKQLNPGQKDGKNAEDAAEMAFRQMELLPADKLMQNKDISLFARVGFRYRKSSSKVDNLNWALPQNQQAPSISSDRAPANK